MTTGVQYNPTRHRDSHAATVAVAALLLSIALTPAAAVVAVAWLGFTRVALYVTVGVCAAPWLLMAIAYATIVARLIPYYRIDYAPIIEPMPAPTKAQPQAVALTVADRRTVEGRARPALDALTPPKGAGRLLPTPPRVAAPPRALTADPDAADIADEDTDTDTITVPGVIRFPSAAATTGETKMPKMDYTDERTGRDDVPADDVDEFILRSSTGGDVGSPSFRAWQGRVMSHSQKKVTRTYWEKLSQVAHEWGRLYRGSQGEYPRIIEKKTASK